jgi:hypothetical protein
MKLDVYGIFFRGTADSLTCKMFQFSIIYDSKNKKIGPNDYALQYMLQQMNINLLRLRSKHKPMTEIKRFISKIKKGNNYIIQNGLRYVSGMNVDLSAFHEQYNYNRLNFLRYYDKTKNEDLSISEQVVESDDPYEEKSYALTNDEFNMFINKKYVFTKK